MDATTLASLAHSVPQTSAPAVAQVAPLNGTSVDDFAAARFSEMMGARVVDDLPPGARPGLNPPAPTGPDIALDPQGQGAGSEKGEGQGRGEGRDRRPSMGSAILDGVEKVSSEFQGHWKAVSDNLGGEQALSMSGMLQLQLKLMQMSMQYELLGKSVSRSTQNIDQLVKMQ